MISMEENGFKNFESCLNYFLLKIKQSNQKIKLIDSNKSLKLQIIDACTPNEFLNQKTKILITNNWINKDVLDSKYYEQFPLSWCGMYAGDVVNYHVTPTKDFNCFINRMDPIRQSWLYQLIRRNIFAQGYISFNMNISRYPGMQQCDADVAPIQVFDQQFEQHLKIFQPEHNIIRSQVPYRNFDTEDLNQIIMQSKFSIVLETYFDRNEIITYTEKIFRCLKLPRPWVMFAMKHAVQGLRDMGFDVLDDLVDHSYDTIDFAINRQVAILDQIEVMCKNQLTTSMIARCEQAAEHNQRLLSKLSNTFNKDVDDTFKRAVAKCLQL